MSDQLPEYKSEDIFKDIPGDPDNVNMVIPPEVLKRMGWTEGTKIKISVGDKGTLVIEKVDDGEK